MMLRYLLNLALFIGLSLPLAEGLSRIDRMPPILREKFDYYREHHDEIDTIVVGSSNMYYGFDPEAFDAAMQAGRVPSRTLNLGYPGMMQHEIDETLRVALKLDTHRRLRRAYIDVRPFSAIENSLYRGTEYEVWWHSPYQTFSVLRTLALSDLPVRRKVQLTFMHLRLFMQNLLPIGLVPNLRRQAELADTNAFNRAVVEKTRGYERLSIDPDVPPTSEDGTMLRGGMYRDRREMLEKPEVYLAAIEALGRRSDGLGKLDRENVAAWRAQVARLVRRGIQPFHLMMPSHRSVHNSVGNALARAGVLPYYLSFNSPARYPELFRLDMRYEPMHLNEHGARRFAQLVAERTLRETVGRESSSAGAADRSGWNKAPAPPGRSGR